MVALVRMGWMVVAYGGAYLVVGGLLTALCGYILTTKGLSALQPLIYFKLVTAGILAYLTWRRKRRERLFYYNLGHPPVYLLSTVVGIDWLIWLGVIIVIL